MPHWAFTASSVSFANVLTSLALIVVEYVPPVAPLLGVKQQDNEKKEHEQPAGPPERPHHDVSIEEFVRDQHRSNGDEGLLAGKK